eukprot:CAMPEP_0180617490 /NCGR_PEP_ID=MMETSP1037_2-20121125/33059_1 /TAXON_ID=632150 /ORGANISM="Azadinium spinosum, Strain 3D9" /LENGTH=208 /DNA_ID=CAMNT_0022637435 /DNA_START=46 /DNA_END=673 /DNA_ORIENTATION=+
MPTTALDLVGGITEYSSRIALKMLFSQFGEVTACWIPPLDSRSNERSYVKFGTTKAAQAALDASNAGALYLDGVCLKAEWRLTPARTQDTRDFEARGSNLQSSRDLMRAAMKGGRGKDDGGGRRDIGGGGSRDLYKPKAVKDSDRDRKPKERDGAVIATGGSAGAAAGSASGGRSRSRQRSREPEPPPQAPALEDIPPEEDEGTSAVI